jgi:hypothetical protein
VSRYGLAGFDGAEPDLAIGSVTGVRWWNLAGTALQGVHGPWVMGENTARCGRRMSHGQDPHPVPEEDCGCGFWAYWTADAAGNPHSFEVPVLGVIEGYGKTLIGERGFRCAKARIAALHIPGVFGDNFDVPPCLQGKGDAAIATWRRITGRNPRVPNSAEILARIAVAEMRLEESYGVPVYSTPGLMLDRHPPTRDYLPERDRPSVLPAKPTLTLAEAMTRMIAKAQRSSDE